MTPEQVVRAAEADGLRFRIIPPDVLVKGPADVYERWLPEIRSVKANLLQECQARIDRMRPDFDLVMATFEVSPEQIEVMWPLAVRDLDRATAIYALRAGMIRDGWRPHPEDLGSVLRSIHTSG